MGSLQRFKVLKHIGVDSTLFFRNGTNDPYNYIEERDDQVSDYDIEQEVDPPEPLVDLLPTSAETLRAFGPIMRGKASRLFRGLLELKGNRLPRLREVTFHNRYAIPTDQKTKAMCKSLGIELSWQYYNEWHGGAHGYTSR